MLKYASILQMIKQANPVPNASPEKIRQHSRLSPSEKEKISAGIGNRGYNGYLVGMGENIVPPVPFSYFGKLNSNADPYRNLGVIPPQIYYGPAAVGEKSGLSDITIADLERIRSEQAEQAVNRLGVTELSVIKDDLMRMGRENYEYYKKTKDVPKRYTPRTWSPETQLYMETLPAETIKALEVQGNSMANNKGKNNKGKDNDKSGRGKDSWWSQRNELLS